MGRQPATAAHRPPITSTKPIKEGNMSMTELLESELVQVSGGAENTLRSGPGKQGK